MGGQGVWTHPLQDHKIIGFLSNTSPDPLNNHKATKPAFNVGPSLAFRWWAYDGSLLMVFGSLKGIYLSKALTCMEIFLYKQELLFCQGDGYF